MVLFQKPAVADQQGVCTGASADAGPGMGLKIGDHGQCQSALAGFSRNEAARYFGEPDGLPPGLVRELRGLAPQPAAAAQAMFLARFQALAGS